MTAVTHRRPILPEPILPDTKRMDRFRAKGGVLIAMLIRETKRDMTHAARTKATLAIRGTEGGAEQRPMTQVPADRAGEAYLSAADGLLAHLRHQALLTPRQCDAAAHLARLYGIGGGRTPWARGDGGDDRSEEAVAAARREYGDLIATAPAATHVALDTLAMGEWMTSRDPLPLWRQGLDPVADRLKLAA